MQLGIRKGGAEIGLYIHILVFNTVFMLGVNSGGGMGTFSIKFEAGSTLTAASASASVAEIGTEVNAYYDWVHRKVGIAEGE
jgi:hypothetical protein